MGRFGNRFPDINVPDSKKDEAWHKDFILGIIKNAIDGRYDFTYRAMQESFDFYDGTQNVDQFKFLQESESGDSLPALWINYNKIRVKIDTIIGELGEKGFNIQARAINKEAVSAKLDKKYEMLGKMNIRPDLEELERISGVPTAGTQHLPDTEEELEEFINNTWKDVSERVITAALKFLIKKYQWQTMRLTLFRDLLLVGRCWTKSEIESGLPRYRRIDPRYMVFDTSAKDDFLSDATYFGEVRYMPLSEAKQVFKLTKEEVDNIKLASSSEISSMQNPSVISNDNKINDNSSLEFITGDANELKVLVFYGEFQDTKSIRRRVTIDKFGNEHYKKVKEKEKGDDIAKVDIKVWRKGTLIGGQIMRDWGFKENMPRSVDDIYDTRSSYVGLCHNFINGQTISKVDLMKGLQEFKNMALYNMQLAMNRAGAKGFMYDISMIPEKWDLEDVLYYLKTAGIGVYDSKKDGVHTPGQAFSEFDMTISAAMGQYMNISNMIDTEMSQITGINDARQGVIQSANQAVGVTQAAIGASQLSTAPMFKAFSQFTEHVFNDQAGLVKICWEDKEVFAPIIGDAGVDFLREDIDVSLHDYGVFIEETPPLLADKAQFTGFMNAALQSGKIEIEDALDLIRETDIDTAIRRLKIAIDKRAKQKQQAEMQMQQQQMQMQQQAQQSQMQQQAQMQQQSEQMKGQRLQQQSAQNNQNKLQQQDIKHQQNLQTLSMKERMNVMSQEPNL